MIFAGIKWDVTRTRGMRGYREGSMGGVPDDPDEVRVEVDGITDMGDLVEHLYGNGLEAFVAFLNTDPVVAPKVREWLQDALCYDAEEKAMEGGTDE